MKAAAGKAAAGMAVFALCGAIFAAIVVRGRMRLPVSDMLDWLSAWLDRAPGAVCAMQYLWLPHNEHHLVWMRLLTAADAAWLGAHGLAFQAAAMLAVAGSAALLAAETARAGMLAGERVLAGWVVPLLALGPAAALDVAAPINAPYVLALFFSLLALTLFDCAEETGPWAQPRRIGAMLAATGAVLANAAAFVVWPALLWCAWRGGVGRRWQAAVALSAITLAAVYLPGLQRNLAAGSPAGGVAGFALAFLGLPLSAAAAMVGAGRCLGGLLLAACLGLLWRWSRRRPARIERLAGAGMIVSLGIAGLAAARRSGAGADGVVPLRYAVLLIPAQAGLAWAALGWIARRRSWQPALPWLAASAAMVMLTQQAAIGWRVAQLQARWNGLAEAFWRGESRPAMVPLIYPDLVAASGLRGRLRSSGVVGFRQNGMAGVK